MRPLGPGWAPIRREAGDAPGARDARESLPRALLGWLAGMHGDLVGALRDRQVPLRPRLQTWLLFAVFVMSALVLAWVMRQLWPDAGTSTRAAHG